MPRKLDRFSAPVAFAARFAGLFVSLAFAVVAFGMDWRVAGLGLATWGMVGWKARCPWAMGCIAVVTTLLAAVWLWPSSWLSFSFAPVWAVLWYAVTLKKEHEPDGTWFARDAVLRCRLFVASIQRRAALPGKHPAWREVVRILLVTAGAVLAFAPFLHDGLRFSTGTGRFFKGDRQKFHSASSRRPLPRSAR